jgi:peptide-methionine (S)-S-oxide reductase
LVTDKDNRQVNEIATLGGGCFWCVEAVFQELEGVTFVESGYSGGEKPNPTYQEVCSEVTGHAEVVQVHFDSNTIVFREILEAFFATHDPTALNRQGGDIGTQYRSAIFFGSTQQREIAEELIAELDSRQIFDSPIVTEVTELDTFYSAEDYHQDYFRQNPSQGYCQAVISPKMSKFRSMFVGRLKTAE